MPEGEACKQHSETAAADPEATGSTTPATETVPAPDPKPDLSAAKPGPQPAKATSRTKSAKRAFQREVGRLRRFFTD
ncbi:MAG: hypothetical protein ACRECX_12605 [Methyloceanibacter sp.]|uniref:hypothetical protein n=1 Tax=Methyloceanibacter sp. TaxID=1965321 RepID=UPI003D6D4CC8